MELERIKELIPDCPDGMIFYDSLDAPIKLYGTRMENGEFAKDFIRLPHDCICNDGVDNLRHITVGVRVRFVTDSNVLAVLGKTNGISAFRERMGFDIRITYEDGYIQSYHVLRNDYRHDYPFTTDEEKITYEVHTAPLYCSRAMRLMPGKKEIEILFPHYCNTQWLKIGLAETACISEPRPYTIEKPVVYLGSSITQGIFASRPASTYEAQISAELDCNYINLGFSGSCRAQRPLLEYIKTLDMSAFVFDYDHNAPSVDFLRETHMPFFEELRATFPTLPILLVSKPDFLCNERDGALRRGVIYDTYTKSLGKGDRNVYFVDGEKLFHKQGVDPSICTFDGCHPNDLGFWCMAKGIGEVLKIALKQQLN